MPNHISLNLAPSSHRVKKLLKQLYQNLPFKKQLFLVFKKMGTPPHSIRQRMRFNGHFEVKAGPTETFRMYHFDTPFENEIFWLGLQKGWEPVSVQVWAALCKQSNVIFDIGANTGVYSLIALAVNPDATIVAFEPLPKMREKLRMNNAINNHKIRIEEIAVSDRNGEALLYDLPNDYMRQASLNHEHVAEGKIGVPVKVSRLDDFISKSGMRPGLMKIDVETHEPEVIIGMGDELGRCLPDILVEVLNSEIGNRLAEKLKPAGYRNFYHIDETTGLQRVESLGNSKFRNYLITAEKLEDKNEFRRFFKA